MKKYLSLLFMAMMTIVSCQKFDDSDIWDKLNDHETRIAYLEEVCKNMNTSIVNLQTVVTALETNDYIISASPLVTGDGYTFLFKSGKSIVIYNGKDGQNGTNGSNGVTPIISVKQDTDGYYYWTIDGEWLIVDGKKVKAAATDGKNGENGTNGVDGITPKFKIEEDYWYVSYDNGESWERLGKATGSNGLNGVDGEDGDSIFNTVAQDDKYVYFYLNDGTMITLSKHNAGIIQFEDLNVKAICCKNWDTNKDGELSYDEAAVVNEITGFTNNSNIVAFTELKYFVALTNITPEAFSGCTSLWKIVLPETIKELGESAFKGCSSLTMCNLPNGMTSIGKESFRNCSSLIDLIIPSTVSDIGAYAFCECKELDNIVIPLGVTSIKHSTFSGCKKLSSVIIPDTIESIETYAFEYCYNLLKVTIPASVKNLSEFAFGYHVMDMYFTSANPPSSWGVVNISMGSTRLYVPYDYIEEYKKAWKSNTAACSRIIGY